MLADKFQGEFSGCAFVGLARVVSWKLISVHGSVIDDTFANQHFPGAFQSLLEDCGQRLVRVRQI